MNVHIVTKIMIHNHCIPRYCINFCILNDTNNSPAVYQLYANGDKNVIVCNRVGINQIGKIFHPKRRSNLLYISLNESVSSV